VVVSEVSFLIGRNINMNTLEVGKLYDRIDVHSIFSPDTVFTPQAGTWGLHGIVKVPDRDGDYVFFVSLGQQQGDHIFDEGISEGGVLSWQSQPRQSLDNKDIVKLIGHDEATNNLHLFLRNSKRGKYSYYGRLGYLEHDSSREKPVYFQWQLMDWDDLNLDAHPIEGAHVAERRPTEQAPIVQAGLVKSDNIPTKKPTRSGVSREKFRARKVADYAERDARNRALGLKGELLVLEFEKAHLEAIGRKDLAGQVRHVSVQEGDGAGYDILSFDDLGKKKYIEVKATRGGLNTDFFISPNELAFATSKDTQFSIYRVYDFKVAVGVASFYELIGDPLDAFKAIPTGYRLTAK